VQRQAWWSKEMSHGWNTDETRIKPHLPSPLSVFHPCSIRG
jgi:hypothetical protein